MPSGAIAARIKPIPASSLKNQKTKKYSRDRLLSRSPEREFQAMKYGILAAG
jgi:hypothetical protein